MASRKRDKPTIDFAISRNRAHWRQYGKDHHWDSDIIAHCIKETEAHIRMGYARKAKVRKRDDGRGLLRLDKEVQPFGPLTECEHQHPAYSCVICYGKLSAQPMEPGD